MNDPVADSMRSILDGHIVLSRALAEKNHYPSIDVLASVSRVMNNVVTPEHRQLAGHLRAVLATYRDSEDLINIGAYTPKSNPDIDYAIERIQLINRFLRQGTHETTPYNQLVGTIKSIFPVMRQKNGR